ncbi:MAG TPA: hypothetical protein VG015_09175, partial [Candidatus Dormibacteraeota bacterium]|nr:hypothetical protein [Candidatus Dormibacteraeota bacterium]
MRIRRLGIVAPIAGAVLVVGGLFTQSVGFAAGSTSPVWQGGVSNFNTPAWLAAWGLKASDNVANGCKGATASYSCDWGYPGTQQTDPTTPGGNLVPVADATAPGGDGALLVKYPAPSGPPSCKCNLGGGQFYQYATVAPGLTSLATSTTMDLKYYYNMPTNFDFGGGGAWGKMPGLWGGGIPGCESGAQHCAGGWSTRYMWRGLTTGGAAGEVYWYTAAGGGFGADLGVGSWTWHADGKWHSIEQSVDIVSGQILVWQDGAQVFNMKETFPAGSFPSGIFLSTFHG